MFKKQCISLLLAGALLTPSAFATAYDTSDLTYEIYTHTVQNDTDFTLDYAGSLKALGDLIPLVKQGISLDEYNYYSLGELEFFISENADASKLQIKLSRNTPVENESFVNQYVETTLRSLKLEGLSDYWRARKIAEHLSEQFSYDKTETIHDPYNMIQSRKGVCQAYALLFYKMARAAGLEVRFQEGSIHGGNHLWNVVKIKDKWFHVDPTNNDFNASYSLFLKSNDFLKSKGFTWTSLIEPVIESDELPDQYYISGDYKEANISAILTSPSPVYDRPDDGKPDLADMKALYEYRQKLSQTMNTFASAVNKNNYAALETLYLQAEQPIGKLESLAGALISSKRAENRKQLDQIYLPYAKAVEAANLKPSKTTYEAALKLSQTTSSKLKTATLSEADAKGYLNLIDTSSKRLSDALAKLKQTKTAPPKQK